MEIIWKFHGSQVAPVDLQKRLSMIQRTCSEFYLKSGYKPARSSLLTRSGTETKHRIRGWGRCFQMFSDGVLCSWNGNKMDFAYWSLMSLPEWTNKLGGLQAKFGVMGFDPWSINHLSAMKKGSLNIFQAYSLVSKTISQGSFECSWLPHNKFCQQWTSSSTTKHIPILNFIHKKPRKWIRTYGYGSKFGTPIIQWLLDWGHSSMGQDLVPQSL